MTFRVGIGSTHIASFSANGVPYMWQSGDVTTTPNEVGIITASNGVAGDQFGISVAVGCGRIVIGANSDDNNSSTSGSAYIFDLDGNQLDIITVSGGTDDFFGNSVAVGCGRIVVGARGKDINSNVDQGAAYIFDLDGNQLGIITASDGAAGDRFGLSVAVGCGRIVVGAPFDISYSGSAYIYDLDGNNEIKIIAPVLGAFDLFGAEVAVGSGRIVVGVYGDDDNGAAAGAAHIFDLNGTHLSKITASDGAANDEFGKSVAVGCGRIVVGAYLDDDNGTSSGSAYIYDLNGIQLAKIKASDGAANDQFGRSVAVGSGRIVVGAQYDDDNGSNSGSAYIYDLDGNQLGIITASNGAANDYFGWSAAVGCGRIVVGSYGDDDNGTNSGSAYIYKTPDVITAYDVADWNSY
jgi:hypothetical protein